MYFIWQSGGLFDLDLRTTGGAEVSLLKPGYRNRGAGPDFLDARIKIGDITWYGPVEFHLKTSDWDAHGHTSDSAYNNVILHVVMEHDREIKTGKGVQLPTLSLQKYLDRAQIEKYRELQKNKGWIPCDGLLQSRMGDFFWPQYLSRLAIERQQQKAGRILKMVESENGHWDKVIFALLGKYLAGKINAISMAELVNCTPYKLILKYRSDAKKLQALLFGQAGFLQKEEGDDYYLELKKEYRHLADMHNLAPMVSAEWCYMPVRPPAFPTIRIAQMGHLMHREARLLNFLLNAQSTTELLNLFKVDAGPYWRSHYVFGKKAARDSIKRVGKATAESLIVNVAAPVLFAYGQHSGKIELTERAIDWLEALPPERNRIVKRWVERGVKPTNALESQALLELKSNYCNKNRCLECALGSKLLSEMMAPYLASGFGVGDVGIELGRSMADG